MTNIVQLEPPRARDDFELVRGGHEGTYWQSADGLVVRVAGVEVGGVPSVETEALHRDLLALACRDATGR